ncbi:MAG: hypothetical protein P1U36_07395 [Legionellaceae bacterium]|nr:hypothetical protein [Legionellaceae bacterium]
MDITFTDSTPEAYETSLQDRWGKRMEELEALQRKQEAEGVADGERPVITLKSSTSQETSQEIGVQTDVDFSNFDEHAYRVLPESAKDKLFLIEKKLTDASTSNQAIFNDINNVFQDLRGENKFYKNQACIQQCLKLAVLCVERLFNQDTTSAAAKKCFQITQRMFQYYFSQANDNRAVIALHLQLRDIVRSDDALRYLIQDEEDGSLLDIEDMTHKATQTHLSQVPDTFEKELLPSYTPNQAPVQTSSQPSHDFSDRLTKLQSASNKPKVLQDKLCELSREISQHAHTNKHSMSPTDWKAFLSLALTAEARLIEHMQTSRNQSDIRPLSKAMQRSAHYFRLLHLHYQLTGASKTLKAELKQSYELMEARSTNYDQMLACYYVETSEKTTSIEKANAREVRASFQSRIQDDTTALCAQFRELSQPLGVAKAPKKKPQKTKEISMDDRRTLLETNLLAGSKSPYDLYQDARKYLNAVLNHISPKSEYDVTYLHQLDNHYDASVSDFSDPLESEQLLTLALGDNRSMLKRAVELYYDAKCRHSDTLYTMHPSDNFITTERFCTHFRREAYAFLLQSLEPGYKIQNLILFKQNCLDILHAENYRAPLLEALARHQLDTIAPRLAAEILPEHQAEESHDADIKVSAPKVRILQRKTPKASPTKETRDDTTIWERISAEYAVKSVDFNYYLNKIEQEGLTDETADFLYDAITDSNRRLLLDEDNEAAFFKLYEKLLETHYKPQEHQALENAIGHNLLNEKEGTEIPADKLMLKTIELSQALLQYSLTCDVVRQLECSLLLGDNYLQLQKIAPKRNYAVRAEGLYREAISHAKKLDNTAEYLAKIMPRLKQIQVATSETKQANENAFRNSAIRELNTRAQENNELSDSLSSASLNIRSRSRKMHQLSNALIHLSQINNLIYYLVFVEEHYEKIRPFFKALTERLDAILAELTGHGEAIVNWSEAAIQQDVSANSLEQMEEHYQPFLNYYSALDNLQDDKCLLMSQDYLKGLAPIIMELEKKIQREGRTTTSLRADNLWPINSSNFLNIPKDFCEISTLSDKTQEALQLIAQGKHWQAIYLILSKDSMKDSMPAKQSVMQEYLFLKACVLQWLEAILSKPQFTTLFDHDKDVLKSDAYSYTLQAISQTKQLALNEAKKHNALRTICQKFKKNPLSIFDCDSNFQACSMFKRSDGETPNDILGPTHENIY